VRVPPTKVLPLARRDTGTNIAYDKSARRSKEELEESSPT